MNIAHITAVIVTYQSAGVIAACIRALKQAGAGVVVVDNASHDGSAAIARECGAQVIELPGNIGFGRGMNRGVAAAATPFCLLINPDATVEPGALEALLDAADSHPHAVIIAPKILEPDGRVFFHSASLLTPPGAEFAAPAPDAPTPVAFVSGACMLVRREWFMQSGGFDERIFLFYEDDDLCRRALDAGHDILYVPTAEILHLRGKSVTPSWRHIYVVRFHQAWSRRYVCHKYGLRSKGGTLALLSAGKMLLAFLTLRPRRVMRHAGSLLGNLAALKG